MSPSLEVLDVRFNMLSGPLDSRLCSVKTLKLTSNSRLCGMLPDCLAPILHGGVSGTELLSGNLDWVGLGHYCTVPTAQCTGVPIAIPEPVRETIGESDGTHCTAVMQGTMTGTDDFNITFSSVENVDALVLKITGVGVLTFGGWFWTSSELHSQWEGDELGKVRPRPW